MVVSNRIDPNVVFRPFLRQRPGQVLVTGAGSSSVCHPGKPTKYIGNDVDDDNCFLRYEERLCHLLGDLNRVARFWIDREHEDSHSWSGANERSPHALLSVDDRRAEAISFPQRRRLKVASATRSV